MSTKSVFESLDLNDDTLIRNLIQYKQNYFRSLLKKNILSIVFPEIEEMIGILSKKFYLGIATSASSQTIKILFKFSFESNQL